MNTLRRSSGKNSAVRQFLSRAALCAALSLPLVAIGPAAGKSAAKSGAASARKTSAAPSKSLRATAAVQQGTAKRR